MAGASAEKHSINLYVCSNCGYHSKTRDDIDCKWCEAKKSVMLHQPKVGVDTEDDDIEKYVKTLKFGDRYIIKVKDGFEDWDIKFYYSSEKEAEEQAKLIIVDHVKEVYEKDERFKTREDYLKNRTYGEVQEALQTHNEMFSV